MYRFLRTVAPWVCSAALAAPTFAQTNVLLVIADDLGTDKLASYAPAGDAPLPATPTLDALAAGGVSFDNAWACPVCSPTRATILTGRYPFRHGVKFALPGSQALALEEITIPEVLDLAQIQGGPDVASGAIGKWHLQGAAEGGADHPNLQGFDHFEGLLNGAPTGPDGYYGWIETINGESSLNTNYLTTEQVDDALAFIEGQDDRWFCWLAFNAPHTPFHAPPSELHGVDLPDVADPGDEPVPFFNAMVEALDSELGRLFASMDPEVLASTTVIFVADNGTTGDVVLEPCDPLRSKGTVYQNGVRVPLIVSGPGVLLPGRRENAPVDVSDLFATSLELLGVNAWPQLLPADATIDSVSLLPYLLNPFAPAQRDFVFTEVHAPVAIPGVITAQLDGGLVAGAQAAQSQAYREGVFKLVRQSNGSLELYNLLADPLETNDLLFPPFLTSDFAAAKARELSRKLQALTGGA
jgi:arylsulfatase B